MWAELCAVGAGEGVLDVALELIITAGLCVAPSARCHHRAEETLNSLHRFVVYVFMP